MVTRIFWMLVGSYLTAIVTVAYGKVSASTIKNLLKTIVIAMAIVTLIASVLDPAVDKSDIGFVLAALMVGAGVGYALCGVACVLVWSLRELRDLGNWIAEMAGLFMEAYREHKKEAARST